MIFQNTGSTVIAKRAADTNIMFLTLVYFASDSFGTNPLSSVAN